MKEGGIKKGMGCFTIPFALIVLHDTNRFPYVCFEKLQSKESTGRMIII